jgi:hypothetical protein
LASPLAKKDLDESMKPTHSAVKKTLTTLFCLALVLVAVGAIGVYLVDKDPPYTRFSGGPASRDQWPKPLVELVADMEKQNTPLEGLDVYWDGDGAFYWKCNATPKLLEAMTARWTLKQTDKNHKTIPRCLSRMPPAFSSFKQQMNDQTVFYFKGIDPPDRIGGNSDMYWVIDNSNTNEVVVRYYYYW